MHPTATGDYVFHLQGSNESHLYISSDDDPANKHLIASYQAPTNEFRSGDSLPIRLQAGKSYFVEVLHKHSTGFDEVTVGWKQPTLSFFEVPIPRGYLSSPAPLIQRIANQ